MRIEDSLLTCMIKNTMGFDGLKTSGFTPSRIPPWGATGVGVGAVVEETDDIVRIEAVHDDKCVGVRVLRTML
jgi:hypothetical protein